MNDVLDLSADVDENEPETAARAKAGAVGKYKTPLEMVKGALYGVVLNTHALFRLGVLGSLLNDAMFTKFGTTNIGGVINYDLSDYTKEYAINRIRDQMNINPGDGGKKPIIISFYDSLSNIADEIIDDMLDSLPKAVRDKKGMDFEAYLDAVSGLNVAPSVSAVLSPAIDTNKDVYFDFLKDFVKFKLYATKVPFNEGAGMSTLEFKFAIELDGTLYNEIVDADEFSPYLVYLWVNNSLMNTSRRGIQVIDPRKVAKHKDSILKLGPIRPKVNKEGFCIHGSGTPMYIPPDLDVIEKYMKIANSCIDEDGNFIRNDLVEKHNLGNALLYVDWVNDILAYTSPTGILNTFNLGNVAPLDKHNEWMFLNTPIYHPNLTRIMRVIQESLNALEDPAQAEKYVASTSAKKILQEKTPEQIYQEVVIRLASISSQDATLANLCGYQLEGKYEEFPDGIAHIRALGALIRHLGHVVSQDKTALKVPHSMANAGVLNRIIGFEYLLRAVDKYKAEDLVPLKEAYDKEHAKAKLDYTKREIDIPNIMVTDEPGRGLTGLLPHQGLLATSIMQTPMHSIKAVDTGGGKTILTLLASIFGIVNMKTIPMIMTKSRLIKGTVTEINSVCQGKMNAMPFTPLILRRMGRRAGIKTFAKFLEWYKALPPNTVLVSSYTAMASRRKIYEDLSVINGFGDAPVYTTQFLLIVKLLGIRIIEGDESTMIKNPDSARSRNSYAVFSHADARSIASGTLVSNTINDLVGQTRAISPYIFGDNVEAFANTYKVSLGIINDESAGIIKGRLRSTTAYYEAQKESWSYMLPVKEDEIRFARMTELQSEFYDILMNEALLMMLEAEKKKDKKDKNADADDDEDEEDDDDEDDDDDPEAEDNAFIAKAKVYLQNVEAFLVAPDSNEQYVRWEKRPNGEDLVSPKVRLADKLITEHLAKHAGNLKQNKIMIFGWNKVASEHFMRHSQYAKQTLHYTAGNEEVVRNFANNENVVLMCADETSLREGENLQMTSLILRQQSVWAPGDHEQAVARMYRPDPRGRYNRESVQHIWLMNEKSNGGLTLDGSKMARLTSKFVSNARFRYEGRPEWRRVSAEFDDLKMIKMNLQLIFYTPKEDMIPYWGSWKTFTEWETQLNTASKISAARDLEAKTGETLLDANGKIIDINQFIRLAMYKVTSTKDIPGSKRVFMPLIPNAIPPDPDNWGFKVMGQQEVPVGTVVYTEFGPGIIVGVTARGAKVQLADGAKIGFKKGDILLVNPKRYKEFAEIVKNPSRWRDESFTPFGKGKTAKAAPVADEEEVIDSLEEDDITEDDEDSDELDVITGMINGWPALLIMNDMPRLKQIKGWNRVDPFISVGFRNWTVAEKFLDQLDGKMAIPDKVHTRLMEEMKMIREGKAMRLGTQIDMGSFRDFFRMQHKKLGKDKNNRYILHPYWIASETDIKLAFDINSHEQTFVSWLVRQGSLQPALTVKKNETFWINTFTSIREATDDMENLRQLGDIDEAGLKSDLAELKKDIQLLKRPRSKPRL